MKPEKQWLDLALQLLEKSLNPLPHELNELDWKADASSKGAPNLAKHISAFANYAYGGYLVFGIDDYGQINSLDQKKIKEIISKISSIAREGVEPQISIDHEVTVYKDKVLLFIYIKESKEKPVHLRGKGIEESYIRSGASTHKMSKQEIGWCLFITIKGTQF
ncbi:AlbA family DNA-binding domain-containing protein [Legionella gresilensis]|uniref:AlbA family DNA-binding domain-containing protein n=1 Tax=Legionella gresilensis TaxID=91823 RepID=UPI001041BB2F|nr:ATP-binding protein [Legionella gresilensis]